MKRRLVILTEIIAPYRIPLFNALAKKAEVDLHVIFLAENDPQLREWRTQTEEIRFSYEVLPSWRRRIGTYNVLFNRGVSSALARAVPDAILCGGYNYVASWQALSWARKHKVPFFLWSESHTRELRDRRAPVEFLKKRFIRNCTGFVVPGKAAFEYLRAHDVNENMVFIAPNAVDNEFFAAAATAAREQAVKYRTELDLPGRYFLFAGRLVRDKGVFELLTAYARLEDALREQVGLVFVGDGSARHSLEQQAPVISPGSIKFAGFAQKEELAIYYALAEMLILPTYTDAWGLVVNEGMACGLTVILSSVAGCAADLLKQNWNGILIPPMDIDSLTSAMKYLASQPGLRAEMGIHSAQHIAAYSAEAWTEGIIGMLAATEAVRG
jgi:glycosyltransferase involved in cell wall biosynthesis